MTPSPLQHLTELLRDTSLPVTVEWVDEMAKLYPYMTLPAKLLLERSADSIDDDTRRRIMQRMALNNPAPETI
jgi:NAD-dependent oxidoreductase involved in siderophore biosynthesis